MYESFSQDVKNEIASSHIKNKCCKKAFLRGMIFGTNTPDEDALYLESENPSVVMHYAKLIKEITGRRKESDISFTSITDPDRIKELCELLEISSVIDTQTEINGCEECVRAFVKGAFLTCGTVTYPENSYHMEFLVRGNERAEMLISLLDGIGTSPKLIERRSGFYGVYFKDSESVLDMFGILGANKATFKMLDVKMYKDFRNNINRLNNCEMANMGKTAAAFEVQMRAIEKIVAAGKLDELPDELKATLDLRAAFPSATLKELAEMHTPPITKSGVNHRLKKIQAFAEKL